MTAMRAYRGHAGEPAPRLVEIERPEVGDGDVLVRIRSAGLTAGTFSLQRMGLLKPLPMTVGHEGAGVVEAVGRGVSRVKPGDRVRIHPTLACGRCHHCTTERDQMCWGSAMMGFVSFAQTVPEYACYHDGFIADYALAPERQIDLLPNEVSFEAGAKLHYLGNAMNNLRAADLPAGATVAILGATGSMGVATIRLAPLMRVARLVLIGRSTSRLEEVRALSPIRTDIVSTDTLDADWTETGGLAQRVADIVPDGIDAIIDYLPEGGPMWQATGSLVTGGALVNMGGGPKPLTLPMRAVMQKCWRIVGTRNHARRDALDVLRLMHEGALRIDDLITHRHALADIDNRSGEAEHAQRARMDERHPPLIGLAAG